MTISAPGRGGVISTSGSQSLSWRATIHAQAFGTRPAGGKLYAFHAPEVECIGKGKARVRYEFGVKASFAVTNARGPGGQFVLGAQARPGLPRDGYTLADQLAQVTRITGTKVERAYVDRGYRGHGIKGADGPEVYISHTRSIVSPTIKRELKRRNAIEPVIGHMKVDGRLERHAYAGTHGDTYAVMMAAIGHNLRLLLAWLKALLRAWVTAVIAAMPTQRQLTAASSAKQPNSEYNQPSAPHQRNHAEIGLFTGDSLRWGQGKVRQLRPKAQEGRQAPPCYTAGRQFRIVIEGLDGRDFDAREGDVALQGKSGLHRRSVADIDQLKTSLLPDAARLRRRLQGKAFDHCR